MDASLTESDLLDDPIALFERWFADAVAAELPQLNAMTLATGGTDGRVSARVVLLKGVDARGFEFFTNYESRKAGELAANPQAALAFLWIQLERQVRVVGDVERLDAAESDAYFATRPRGSQIGAWASQQSQPLADRADLEAHWAELEERYAGVAVPRPPHWGGFRVIPREIEFWQGRTNRLHDRFAYTRAADGSWQRARLQP
ncbi:pyridoxamine 5'-phosphate oxidase [Conexibacter woesei]|uniref:Pyridoxine/pyridoxamine 5'-phosphate oxidase n=1 Tax=Conexibacter woesei (strain DSM 14684 / CCUG 47730 / CIP 108061 / JCM 11494 / NBRC 100937 / ID131577) TaxID=469383 RepID=D3F8V1_CONWI|nr:pyridoxamine 5'-phosphate oxidase [Conexibacter woesei]ADB52946.1 pyridoxamine 5'-phosphate oxidase [Conexibacter woesei DSM 14684]